MTLFLHFEFTLYIVFSIYIGSSFIKALMTILFILSPLRADSCLSFEKRDEENNAWNQTFFLSLGADNNVSACDAIKLELTPEIERISSSSSIIFMAFSRRDSSIVVASSILSAIFDDYNDSGRFSCFVSSSSLISSILF